MSDGVKKYFCPRLLDYIILVGPRTSDMSEGQTSPSLGGHSRVPHLLRRYPPENHQDFALPPDVVIFCQPEGCDRVESSLNAYNNPSQTNNSFVFLLTEKDTSRVRYGVCLNFYRPLQKCPHKPTAASATAYPDASAGDSAGKQQQQQSSAGACLGQPQEENAAPGRLERDHHFSSSTQDNESGIKMMSSTGPDSDSVGSSALTASSVGGSHHHHHHHYNNNKQQPTTQQAVDNTSASLGGTDSLLSSNSGVQNDSDQMAHHQKHHHHSNHHHHHHHHQHHQMQQQQQRHHQAHPNQRLNTPALKEKSKITYALNSICIISHHPFFSTFRECLFIIKKFIQACDDRNLSGAHSQKENQIPKCKCHLRHLYRGRRSSQHSHLSQASRKSVANFHTHSCPYSNPIWSLLTMPDLDEAAVPPSALPDVAEIEAWMLRLLSVPVPVPEKTKIEVEVMSTSLKQPLLFALPDHTRFSLIDFPLHLPLELLGVQTCLQVLTCILLEHKVALQSKDYNALSMSVMAFVTMIYPLEYMFPVIPLLPSCMSSAEQLLLAPTPFIIGFPSSFFKFKHNFTLPNDVWIVDLDANKVKKPPNVEDLPPLPEYEGAILVQNLQKILNSMSGVETAPNATNATNTTQLAQLTSSGGGGGQLSSVFKQPPSGQRIAKINEGQASMPTSPYKRRSSMAAAGQLLQFAANKLSGSTTNTTSITSGSPVSSTRSSFAAPAAPVFDPQSIINNDTDAVDVATRIAMVRFFNSQEVLANFIEHTRTIRLYPRPVVSFQKSSFIQSRAKASPFLMKLVETQAVEYMAEWALCPDNVAFQRIQTGVYDPATIGDKPKWYGNQLEPLKYQIWDNENREFYEEIATLIRDSSSGISGAASSTGKFSDYYDDTTLDKANNEEHSDLEENDLEERYGAARDTALSYDINNNNTAVNDEDSHSPYLSSNDSSPCYSSDREMEETDKQSEGRALTLNDVMNMRMRRSSMSSSISSNGSWDNNQVVMQSIPANYQHDVGRFPPIRCDINKHYRPSNTLVHSLHETRQFLDNVKANQQSGQDGDGSVRPGDERKRKEAIDSSDDEDEFSKVIPDSSSCDESGTEEFDFTGVNSKPCDTPIAEDNDGVVKLFESVDSDTVVASKPSDSCCLDENNNSITTTMPIGTPTNASMDSLSMASNSTEAMQSTQQPDNDKGPILEPLASRSDTVQAIINSQKMRVTSGVAKLIDRASSISDSKFLRQGSVSGGPSPLPKNIGGEQMGAFFERVTSEARDAVKEAKAAIDLGKNALKTTAMPAADAGRQKLLKNIHNLGEAFFEDRRDSSATRESVEEAIVSHETDATPDSASQLNRCQSQPKSVAPKVMPDSNGFAGRANVIGGWLGSKATGFANRMRDRTRPGLGPFPSIDESPPACSPTPMAMPTRRASLMVMPSRRSSIACSPAMMARPRLRMIQNSSLNQTFAESFQDDLQEEDESNYFVGQKLVQKSRLIRHSTGMNDQPDKAQPIRATQSDSDNQQFLKEVSSAVMKGEGVGWLKLNRVKKLMEDESYRDLILSQINKNIESRIRPDDRIGDVKISKSVWRGMVRLCSAIVSGLEQSYMHNKLVGMASVFSLLEIAHTHYWTRELSGDRTKTVDQSSDGRKSNIDSLSSDHEARHLPDEGDKESRTSIISTKPSETLASDRDGSKDLRRSSESSMGPDHQESPESIDSNVSVSTSSNQVGGEAEEHQQQQQQHQQSDELQHDNSSHSDESSVGGGSRSIEPSAHEDSFSSQSQQVWDPKQGLPKMNQATLTSGVPLASLNDDPRVYLFEGLLHKDRSPLWDQLQFWEEAFLDAVSHERCLIGMDQGPSEMLQRYKLLYEMDKKRLEHEEDRLLSTLLYNMTAFMLMLQVDKHFIKQKIRRLLGKCHIGLVNSAEINHLLEQIESLKGNDIDLKPMASRQVRRQTFTLHQGTDTSGDIVFMEVRDDGLVLRGLDGVIIERWWYERLINMTYSPKMKIVCFWRKSDGQTKLNKFYTRKCQELYSCIKDSMRRAETSYGANRVCSELGGEFPVLDVKSGEGGILQVCMEGVGLLFATSKYFVRLENIRKCFTQKGGTFVLEEYNPKNRQLIQKHFRSQMADQICYAILCVFSYVAAGQNKANLEQQAGSPLPARASPSLPQ